MEVLLIIVGPGRGLCDSIALLFLVQSDKMRSFFLVVFLALIASSAAQLRVRDMAQIGDVDEPQFKPIVRARDLSKTKKTKATLRKI